MSAWNDDLDELTPKDPGTLTVGTSTYPRTADEYCPHCDAPLSFEEIVWGDDQPPEDDNTPAECWKCGEEFHARWYLEPRWLVEKIRAKATS